MSTREERQYIGSSLMPEIKRAFELWAKEYQQERDLGKRGEFANLYRKARKLKTLIWDETGPVNPKWREDERTIIIEVIAHGLLMLTDLDKERGAFAKWLKEQEEDEPWEDEEEEELTPQGKKADQISRDETRDYLRKRAAPRRRREEGNGIPLVTARPIVAEEAREKLGG